MLAARFCSQFVFKVMIKILNSKFIHNKRDQLAAISDQLRFLKVVLKYTLLLLI